MQSARPISSNGAQNSGSAGASPLLITLLMGTAIAIALATIYHPVLSAGYLDSEDLRVSGQVRRDDWMFCNNCLGFFARMIRSQPGDISMAPLARVSLIIDAHLARDALSRPFQSHLGNLFLHGLNAMLLFSIMRMIGARMPACILLAILFALHPIHVAGLAGIARRGLFLGMLFAFLAIMAYLRFAQTHHKRWRALVLIWYLAAILSHGWFILLPLLMLLIDVYPLNRSTGRLLIEKWPLFVVMLLSMVVVAASAAPRLFAGSLADPRTLAANLSAILVRTVFPLRLSPFYPPAAMPPLAMVVAIPLLCLGMLIWSSFRGKPLFVALSAAAIALLPTLLHARPDLLIGDAWLYPLLPLPLIVLAAWTSRQSIKQSVHRLAVLFGAGLTVLLTAQTYVYAMHWDSTRDLYLCALRQYPAWAGGYVGLVEASIAEYDFDSALHYAEKAVEYEPNQPMTQFYLGTVLLLHKDARAAKAIAPMRRALAARADWPEALQNLGVALARTGKFAPATPYLEKARDLSPKTPGIRIALGNAYMQQNMPSSARAEFQEALKYRSDWVVNLGLARAWAAGEVPELARRHLAVAVEQNPASAAQAATFPELARYAREPGFESLLNAAATQPAISDDAGFPAAIGAEPAKDNRR